MSQSVSVPRETNLEAAAKANRQDARDVIKQAIGMWKWAALLDESDVADFIRGDKRCVGSWDLSILKDTLK